MLEILSVIRRCGKSVPLNIQKIRTVCEWACEGLNCSPLELEGSLTTRLRDGITTKEIQDNLINCALEKCDLVNADWRFVAGRLHLWGYNQDVIASRGYGYESEDFNSFVYQTIGGIQRGKYSELLWQKYSHDDLVEAQSWIKPKWDYDYDYAGAVLLTNRYLQKDELIQEMYLVTCLLIASVEDESKRLQYAKRFYERVASRKISMATSILANLRAPGGNGTSCFIHTIEDNLESIFDEIHNAARISKSGGGVGTNLSKIRATGSMVMGKENASGGVIPWVKLLNDTAVAVNQGGKRSGAITVALDIWHYDVIEFLEMQKEHGDQRRKAYDVFPQLVIPDLFMKYVEKGRDWWFFDPYEVKEKLGYDLAELWGDDFVSAYGDCVDAIGVTRVKKINAKDLMKQILKSCLETGLPYLAFKDTINRANPNKHQGYIPNVNLCTESFSNVKSGEEIHSCNLISINLSTAEGEKRIDRDCDLMESCEVAVRMLDNTIDVTTAPVKEALTHNQKYRTIGVGFMGLADYLALNKKTYQDTAFIDTLFERLSYSCLRASADLASERGAYPAFVGSEWANGNMDKIIPGCAEHLGDNHISKWDILNSDIKHWGIRNSHVMAIAPNTSSSLIHGCTASILPVYKRFFYDKASKGAVPIAPPFINDKFWFYQENITLDQKVVVNAVSTIQKWIDTGISMELVFNLNEGIYGEGSLTAKDIFDTVFLAWQKGCKAVYYIRSVQKDSIKDECTTCAN